MEEGTGGGRLADGATLVLGLVQLGLGVWMAAAPRSFYDAIGGFGPFNDHYERDVATFYLALGVALVVAWRRPAWRAPVLWIAVLQYGFHVVNHVVDAGDAHPSWVGPADVVSLAAGAVAFALLLAAGGPRDGEVGDMRVFVAGAAGVIGRRLVPMLVEAGHDVTGTTRRPDRAEAIREQGAEPVIVDVFDAGALTEAIVAAKPDVVVHELTDIPQAIDTRRYAEQMAGNDRVRREGTRNLVAAAREAGARRLVVQSIAFAYAPEGGDTRDEDDPLYLDAPDPLGPTIRSLADMESQVLGAGAPEGVVLRYGYFYGPGTAFASDGSTAERVRRHRFPVVGAGSGVFSFVHVDDAAAATVLALDHGEPGVYNVVDDEPSPVSEWLPEYAQVLGAKPPGSVPTWLARAAGGGRMVLIMEHLRGASNAKARTELGWTPMYPSWREGFREGLG